MDYRIVEGTEQIGVDEAERLLKMTYWANHRSTETIRGRETDRLCPGGQRLRDHLVPVRRDH